MKRSTILLLFLALGLVSCKKKENTPEKGPLKAVTQISNGQEVPLFEFSETDGTLISYHGLLSVGTGTVLKKSSYKLVYNNGNLVSAVIDGGVSPKFTFNEKNQITSAISAKGDFTYVYSEDKLQYIGSGSIKTTLSYSQNGDMVKAVTEHNNGYTTAILEYDVNDNPLKGIPLHYLEGEVPIWTMFSLSNHNVISITYYYINYQLGSFSTKETFKYTFDRYNRPINVKRYNALNDILGNYTFQYQ